jgi:PhnB protein
MASVNPYVMFNGNCEEAFDFYKSVFGGEFSSKARFDEAPADQKMGESEGNKIMHISLPIGKDSILMGNDQPDGYGTVDMGNSFYIAFDPDSEEHATKVFNGLSTGGQVIQPLEKTFWGAYFGMLKDKYGIQWMVNYQMEQQQ